jgi:hypothetical protein
MLAASEAATIKDIVGVETRNEKRREHLEKLREIIDKKMDRTQELFEKGKLAQPGGITAEEARGRITRDTEKLNKIENELEGLYATKTSEETTTTPLTEETMEQPPIDGAQKAPDGKWYIKINDQWNLVE